MRRLYKEKNKPIDMDYLTDRSIVDPETGCWLWQKAKTSQGYGNVRFQGKNYVAHVLAYLLAHGPKPEGLDLDHICRNRNCVNPDHLEPVTRQENLARGLGNRFVNPAYAGKKKA
jgi:hypothetical protein